MSKQTQESYVGPRPAGPQAQAYWIQITEARCKAAWYSKYRTYRQLVKRGV
jgi:hypothetical protein